MSHRSHFEIPNAFALLGFDVSQVIALRMFRLAAGGSDAGSEAKRMVGEKAEAFVEAQFAAATAVLAGAPMRAGPDALRVYQRRVSANRRRLSRTS